MNFQELLNNKELKPKEKIELLSKWLIANPKKINTLIDFAATSKDTIKATCIEVIEFATKTKPAIASLASLQFVSKTLTENAPRVKWESAKVIGNIAHLYPGKLDEAITNLLANAEHPGTVVRWSAAFALGQIIQIPSFKNKDLISAIETICNGEQQNSIKKNYLAVLKKLKK